MSSALIIFLKKPDLGKVKTRLAASIGNEKALAIYRFLLTKHAFQLKGPWDILFYWSPAMSKELSETDNYLQKGADIGERMFNSFVEVLGKYDKAVLIGADIPEVSADIVQDAFNKLENDDVVFGPALDGGYYLIAMKKARAGLFMIGGWSNENVLKNSMAKAKELSLSHAFTSTLRDLDTYEDLIHFPELMSLTQDG